MAFCDVSTLDPRTDLEVSDYVTPTTSREHCMVYARSTHRWWYLSHQKTTEAFVFRQYDSRKGPTSGKKIQCLHHPKFFPPNFIVHAAGTPHASFLNPYSVQAEPRESIEIGVVVYWP